jgi:hypothetical protein
MGSRTFERLGWLLFLAFPFGMFAWLLPFVSRLTFGNDYSMFGPAQQLELMWSVWKGTFPLYMPGFAEGHATAAMTLGQLYHPLSWLSSLMPGYRDGLALEWNAFFRLLSLGLAHAFLFKLCRRLKVGPLPAFLLTVPAIYNLRMLDSFRYGAPLDAYVGMVLGATAVGFLYCDVESKRPIPVLALCAYLLTVSGHPQWAFFGWLGVGLFALFFPWLAPVFDPGQAPPSSKSLVVYAKRLALGFGTGLLLASPYLLTFYLEYFKTNQSRTANGYPWTLAYADSVLGELCNFLLPFHADVHGAFAGSGMFLLAALFPVTALAQRPPKVLWLVYAISLMAFLFAMGKATWVHPLLVKALPLFGAFRVPGRLTLWIPLFALPIWAWLLRESNRRAMLAACALAFILCLSHGLGSEDWLPVEDGYSPHRISAQGLPPSLDLAVILLSGATVVFLGGVEIQQRFARVLVALSLVAMVATTWLCLRFGTWSEPKRPTLAFAQIAQARESSVLALADPGNGMEMGSITEYLRRGLKPRRALGILHHHVEHKSSDDEILQLLQENPPNLPLLVDRPVEALSQTLGADQDQVDLVHNTSNRFVFDAAAATDGYFVLGLPWLPGFSCKVDGARAEVVKANALFPAVFVPHGTHQIDFRYVSWPFLVGVALAFATVAAWAFGLFRNRRRVAVGTLVSGALLAGFLHLAILDGPSFGTHYHWAASPEPSPTHAVPDVSPSR